MPLPGCEGRPARGAAGRTGWGEDEHVCVVTVGGSGVGEELLRRATQALPLARERDPSLRMVAVAGPRIDPSWIAADDGLCVHAFVPDLQRQLAACDVAIVQGGLATTRSLTARPETVPLRPARTPLQAARPRHHRLRRHRAGRWCGFADAHPELLANAIVARSSTRRPTICRSTRRRPAVQPLGLWSSSLT